MALGGAAFQEHASRCIPLLEIEREAKHQYLVHGCLVGILVYIKQSRMLF